MVCVGGLALGACGGSGEASTAEAPASTTEPSPETTTAPSVDLPEEAASEDGFVEVSLPEGWQVRNAHPAGTDWSGEPWSGETAIDPVLSVESADGAARIAIARDKQYLLTPDPEEAVEAIGPAIDIERWERVEVSADSGASSAHATTGSLESPEGDQEVTLDVVELDGQTLYVIVTAPDGDPVWEAAPSILDSIAVDTSVLDPLAHANPYIHDLTLEDGRIAFSGGLLVPATWQEKALGGDGAAVVFEHPDGEHFAIQETFVPDQTATTFDDLVARAERSDDFVEVTDSTSGQVDGVPYRVFVDIDPDGGSSAAVLVGYDGLVAHTVYLAATTPAELEAIMSSLKVSSAYLEAGQVG